MQANPDCIVDPVGYGRNRGGQRSFAAFFRSKGTFRIDALDDYGINGWRFDRRWAAILEQAAVHQHAILPDHFFGQGLTHAHPHRADNLPLDRNRIESATAIVRCPHFVHRDFASLFVNADFGNLRGVRIGRGWPNPASLVLSSAGLGRRGIRARAREGAVKIDGSDHGLSNVIQSFGPSSLRFCCKEPRRIWPSTRPLTEAPDWVTSASSS